MSLNEMVDSIDRHCLAGESWHAQNTPYICSFDGQTKLIFVFPIFHRLIYDFAKEYDKI